MDYTTLTTEAINLISRIRSRISNLMIDDWDTYKTMEGRLEDLLAMAEDRLDRRINNQQGWERYEDAADWGIA